MSLINQVLRDLDARKAGRAERAGMPAHTRALPPERTYPWKPLAFLVLGIAGGAGGVWIALDRDAGPPPVSVPRAVLPSPPPPVPMPPMPLMPVPVPEPAVVQAVPEIKPEKDIPAARPAPPKPPRAANPAPPSSAVPPTSPTPSREPAVSAPAGGVEKSARPPLASEAAEAEYRKAIAAYKRGGMTEAVASLRLALQLDANHVQARQALLSLLVDQRQWKEVLAVAEEGLARDPRQAGWAMILARLEVEHGQISKAVETLARHATHAERNPDYLAFHALLLQKSGRSREAAERYRAALTLRADDGRWWYGLGLALEAEGHPQEARIAYQRAKESGNLPADLSAAVDQKLR